ncbi:MAG: hypothetical protein A2W19_04995 [Spirochaetes bacterium RBG_16_49_21]|nr:MAG: hypothetical protein A2W19_04995 [Spirochaetes bacterium RBG_16_49_21]
MEYDSRFSIETLNDVHARLDRLISDIQEETGADQIDLIGHSYGGLVSYEYIESSTERAMKIARYVSVDSFSSPHDRVPAGIPTLALWGQYGTCQGCSIVGAKNVTITNHTHVQMATSAESFVEMYKFFTSRKPFTKEILPEHHGRIEIAGRAVLFPQNVGVAGATLEIWEVKGSTGKRKGKHPIAVYMLDATGAWGPVTVKQGAYYEFSLVREAFIHHFYAEPFTRSNYLVRLNAEKPGAGIGDLLDRSDHHTNIVIIRYNELRGNQDGNNDALEINGINVISPATHPMSRFVTATFVFDKGVDGVSNLGVATPPPSLFTFMTGVDLYIPGITPPDSTVSVVLTPANSGGKTQRINIPNWASLSDRAMVLFHDYIQSPPHKKGKRMHEN